MQGREEPAWYGDTEAGVGMLRVPGERGSRVSPLTGMELDHGPPTDP